MATATESIINEATAVNHGSGNAVLFWNAYNVALASDDADYATLSDSASAVFCDGVPIVWAGKRLHRDVAGWSRVYGPDTMCAVLDQGRAVSLRHYLLGSDQETLAALTTAITERWPGVELVGVESPPFRPPTVDELLERDQRISESGAQCVWVGLGTPKQDIECRRLANALPVTALGVGAAFDFIAGTKRQAPAVLQRSGLEWAFRLAIEPRRLARRYFWGNPRFVTEVIRQKRAQ
ncbi:MAG: WecB/TagA/CpsF family glycosyltransferase [Actinobacteria bacterium]|nr:WecB/TagA/CpsF family glycosyltransferase [Actinomycetota bacterium]